MPAPSSLVRILALALVVLGRASAQEGAPDPHSRNLAELCEPLEADPNDPGLHLRVADEYFQRGALDDGERTFRHVDRALALDRSREPAVHSRLLSLRPGRRERPQDEAERRVDLRLDATLQGPGTDRVTRAPDLVRAGLAERMVARPAPRDPASFQAVRQTLDAAFGLDREGSPEVRAVAEAHPAAWREPAQPGPGEGPPGPWEQVIRRAIEAAIGREPNPGLPREIAGEAVPDPITRRDEAVLAYAEGRREDAVAGFLDAAAAVEVARSAELAELAAGEGVPPEPSPPAPASGPPPPSPPLVPGAPLPPLPPPLPPETRSGTTAEAIAERSLAAVEAMANPEIPESQVEREVAAAARVGAVGDPLLLDLDGDGVPGVTGSLWPDGELAPEGRVAFDFEGRGVASLTEWVLPGRDALLVVDLDRDGKVSSGLELVGDTHGASDGFARLAVFDVDRNGWIEGPEARGFLLWIDDGDGTSAPGELSPLAAHGILRLSTRPVDGVASAVTRTGRLALWDWMPDLVPLGAAARLAPGP